MVTIKWITRVNVRVSGDREAEQRPGIMGSSILSGREICGAGSVWRDEVMIEAWIQAITSRQSQMLL